MARNKKSEYSKEIDKKVGARIKECREFKGKSIRQTSAKIGFVESQIRFCEKGERTANPDLLKELSKYLDIDINYFKGADNFTCNSYTEYLKNRLVFLTDEEADSLKEQNSACIELIDLSIRDFFSKLLENTKYRVVGVEIKESFMIQLNVSSSEDMEQVSNYITKLTAINNKLDKEMESIINNSFIENYKVADISNGNIYCLNNIEMVDLLTDISALMNSRLNSLFRERDFTINEAYID